jgi:hypothetical protein
MVDMRTFQNFMQSMRGKDPNQILNQMISSGQISQQQLNQVQMQAKQMESQFEGLKKMFGFK